MVDGSIVKSIKQVILESKNKIEITERSKVEGDTVALKAIDSIDSGKISLINGASSVMMQAENSIILRETSLASPFVNFEGKSFISMFGIRLT